MIVWDQMTNVIMCAIRCAARHNDDNGIYPPMPLLRVHKSTTITTTTLTAATTTENGILEV